MSKAIAVKQNIKEQKYNEKWLKSFKGFDHYSKEDLKNTIKQLEMLANVVCTHILNTS